MTPPAIPGALNLRPVDSYAAAGWRIRPGALWRSGAFDTIGPEGLAMMRARGVTTAFDLRSTREKARRPSALLTAPGFTVASVAHDMRSGDLTAVLRDPAATPEDCVATMIAIYRRLPRLFAGVYAEALRTVIAAGGAVAIHCTAGKDRTGVAVALILDLLGVSRDDIFEDYQRSNAARDALCAMFDAQDPGPGEPRLPSAKVEPVIAADARYLAAMFEGLEDDFGTPSRYARHTLGLTDAEIAALKARLLG